MNNLLAIDPALTCTGWAFFRDGQLSECGIVRTKPDWPTATRLGYAAQAIAERDASGAWPAYHTVIEWPQVYTYGKSKGDPNDLLLVAGVAAACATQVAYAEYPAELVKPAAWKGQTPKEVHNARVLARLSADEQATLKAAGVPSSLEHNMIDAIGLGLWKLGRMGRNHGQAIDLRAANDDQETPQAPGGPRRRRRIGRG